MKLARSLKVFIFILVAGMHTAYAQEYLGLTAPYSISIPQRKTYTIQEVRDGIIFGARLHQWRVESESPGLVTLRLGAPGEQYVLRVEIAYDTKSYSVKYHSSEGLGYVKGTTSNPTSNISKQNQANGTPVMNPMSGSIPEASRQDSTEDANSTPVMNPMSGSIPAASRRSSTNDTSANSTPVMNPMSGAIPNSNAGIKSAQQGPSIDYRYVRWMNTLTSSINRELYDKKM